MTLTTSNSAATETIERDDPLILDDGDTVQDGADRAVEEPQAVERSTPQPRAAAGSILVVCTANMARSPFIEVELGRLLREAGLGGIEVSSAGTDAVPDTGVHRLVAEELARRGGDTAGFRSRILTRELVESADLVLTASRGHRDHAGGLVPRGRDRMFTLLQLQRLLAAPVIRNGFGPDLSTVERLVALANANRGWAGTASRRDDIPDPVGGGTRAFSTMFNLVDRPLSTLVDTLSQLHEGSIRGETHHA